MDYESMFNTLLVDCFQMTTTGAWSSLKRITEFFKSQLQSELSTLSFSEQGDRRRLEILIRLDMLDKLVKDIESYASEYIEKERNK